MNSFIGCTVRASTEQQECAHILLIKLGDSGCVNHRLQEARPKDMSSLHRVVQWTHAREVACQDGGTVGLILYDDAPIA